MVRPMLRLATRFTRRTRMTAWAIAFACMVLVGALSLADGFANGIESVTGRIDTEPALYIRGPELIRSEIDPDALAAIPGRFVALRAHPANLEINGLALPIAVVALVEYQDGTGATLFPTNRDDVSLDRGLQSRIEAASGSPPASAGNLSLLGLRLTDLPIVGPPPSRLPIFPDDWAYVRADLLAAMDPLHGGSVQGILVERIDPAMVQALGLTKLEMVGAIGFVRGGVAQVQTSLRILALVVAVVIGLLVYAAMALEVHQRGTEIRILRSLGASARSVAGVYEAQALLLALVGAILGAALGIVVAHGVVSLAPVAGLPNLVILAPPLGAVVLTLLMALGAALVAGLVPSRRAAVLVRKGAVPS
jgi:FtsX-like permease family protein